MAEERKNSRSKTSSTDWEKTFNQTIGGLTYALKILPFGLKWYKPMKEYLLSPGAAPSAANISFNLMLCSEVPKSHKSLLEQIQSLTASNEAKKVVINKLMIIDLIASGGLVVAEVISLISIWMELSKISNLTKESRKLMQEMKGKIDQLQQSVAELEQQVLIFILSVGFKFENVQDASYRQKLQFASEKLANIKSQFQFEKECLRLQRLINECNGL